MKSKELRVEHNKLVADARALVLPDGSFKSKEDEALFDTMSARMTELETNIARLDALEAREKAQLEADFQAGKTDGLSADEIKERRDREKAVFAKFIRFGAAALRGEEADVLARRATTIDIKAAMGVDVGSTGGFLVPDGFMQTIVDAQKAYGGMIGVSTPIDTGTGNPLPIPTDNDTTNIGAIVGENTSMSDGADVAFGAVVLGAYMYSSKPVKVSLQLLQDSFFDIDAFLANKLGIRIARAVNAHLTTGTGASQPRGVVTAATVGQTGTTGETTSIIFDDLIELKHSVDPAYRTNARFMMNDTSLKIVRKLKDSQGRYLWEPGSTVAGTPSTIDGDPYTINQDMPSMGANAQPIAYGDFSNYYVRRVAGAQLMRLTERYADVGQVGFLLFQRWDGNLVDAGTHPVKLFQNSAS